MNPPVEKVLAMQAEMARFENEISVTMPHGRPRMPPHFNPNMSLRFVPHSLLRPPGGAAFPPPHAMMPRHRFHPHPLQRPFIPHMPHFQQMRPSAPSAATSAVIAAPPTKYIAETESSNGGQSNSLNVISQDTARHQTNTEMKQTPAFTSSTSQSGQKSVSAKSDASRKAGKPKGLAPKRYVRTAGGEVWKDDSLLEWDPNDYRVFCGDLGNEVSDELLAKAFRKYSSFQKAKVIRDKKTNKTKGFGFVSFKDPQDFIKAIREMDGKYIGNRPIKLKKSMWKDRNLKAVKKKDKEKKKLGLKL